MLVTVTGTFKNAGDYLIGERARKLLTSHVDSEIVNISRRDISDSAYDVFNQARAVLLTGGPAYQRKMFPDIYPIELERIKTPVIPYGLGWKGGVAADYENFKFTDDSEKFIRQLHHRPELFSSTRDYLTLDLLKELGITNVLMTGCPAWYDETKLSSDYERPTRIKCVALSMPAFPQPLIRKLIPALARMFPLARRYLTFQAGIESTHRQRTAEYSKWNRQTALFARAFGFKPVSFAADLPAFEQFMSGLDLHLGFRVHSHIYAVSQRITSLLIAEDSRAVGQSQAMGVASLSESASISEVLGRIDALISGESLEMQTAVETVRAQFPVMLKFLSQI